MIVRRQSNGEIITLLPGSLLGSGGEARVYSLRQETNLVAKIYHSPDLITAQKLTTMIANPPDDGEADREVKSIAWPVDLLLTANGEKRIVGFLMPRVAAMRSIADFYNPRIRRQFNPLFNYFYLHRTARNLATAVRLLHDRGYIVGDINESNILVSETALITLVDADSFQVHDFQSETVFRCSVGKPEFTPPELQSKSFAEVDRLPEHDLFGLSVILFQLLMEGTHPFAGQFQGSSEPPTIKERIASGHFVYGTKEVPYLPAPTAPRFTLLDPALQSLFIRCFEDGHDDPKARPSAGAWQVAFAEAEIMLTQCRANEQHRYSNHLQSCPWCERAKLLKGRDPFPSIKIVQSGRHLYTAPSVQETATGQSPSVQKPPLFASSITQPNNFFNFPDKLTKFVIGILLVCFFIANYARISIPRREIPIGLTSPPIPQPTVTIPKTPEEIFKGIEIYMVRIPSGTFTMGSPDGVGDADEAPQHQVTVSLFYMSLTEVTQEQWREVAYLPKIKMDLPFYPSKFRGDQLPVESISWNEAVEFCERLSQKTGKKYRLPTEAEWEYACRAGNSYIYPNDFDTDKMTWYGGNSNGSPHNVAQTISNDWGFYDMYGNVWEWCSDWYADNYYSNSSKANPTGATSGTDRVIRGGGWDDSAGHCRPAYRDKAKPGGKAIFLGFRLARSN